jgi:light-regulated signal transduction histidine kinase (bacteriophytochrome)
MLQQIFRNLILNGVKFNHSSPKRIQLGWQPNGQEGYLLFVRDNGIGIDQRYHEKIFGVFQRLHNSKEFEGTGIGLALVKKAADKLQGSVWVESSHGIGSTFYITLPKTE